MNVYGSKISHLTPNTNACFKNCEEKKIKKFCLKVENNVLIQILVSTVYVRKSFHSNF